MRPPAKGQFETFDIAYPGLALRVSYGGAKSWSMFYRHSGRLRRLELGRYPAVSLNAAREMWREARGSLAKGIDPRGEDRNAETFAAAIAQWLASDDQKENRVSSRKQVEGAVKGNLLPMWGERRVDSITKRDILAVLDTVKARAPVMAKFVYAVLGQFFKWAIYRDIVAINPMATVKPIKAASSRDRVLTDDELVSVWRATYEGPYGAAARLLMLTGARREEISQLKWGEIVGTNIELAADRTKNGEAHTIPLSTPAREVLASIKRAAGDYIFSVDGGKKPLNGWSPAKVKLDKAANIAPWRIHDLRRTLATGLQKMGVNLQTTEAVLGHTSGSRAGVVGIYQRHDYATEKAAALEAWGAHVIGLVEGRAEGNVLPIRDKR
jgi:integrase